MQKSRFLIGIFSLIIISFSCSPPTEKEENNDTQSVDEVPEEIQVQQALYDEIMEVHDEMMPKMEDLMRIRGEVQEIKDSITAVNQGSDTQVFIETIQLVEEADESMMNWMRNFEPATDEMTHDEIMAYYKGQKEKMDTVKLVMENALRKGEELIDNN